MSKLHELLDRIKEATTSPNAMAPNIIADIAYEIGCQVPGTSEQQRQDLSDFSQSIVEFFCQVKETEKGSEGYYL